MSRERRRICLDFFCSFVLNHREQMGNFKQNDFYVWLRNTQNKWEQKPSLLHSKSLLWQSSKWTMKSIPAFADTSQMGDFRALQWHFIAICRKFIDLSFTSWTIEDGWTVKAKAPFHSININIPNYFFLVQRFCVPVLSMQIRHAILFWLALYASPSGYNRE